MGWDMVAEVVVLHPFASVAVTVYVPATAERVGPDVVLASFHKYVIVPVPPFALAVAEPVPPKQVVLVSEVITTFTGEPGWLMLIEAEAEQLFASVTSTL